MINVTLFQFFWDALLPSTSTWANIFHETLKCLNIWYVLHVLLGVKYGFMRFSKHCILFLFTFYTASQIFGTWECPCGCTIYSQKHSQHTRLESDTKIYTCIHRSRQSVSWSGQFLWTCLPVIVKQNCWIHLKKGSDTFKYCDWWSITPSGMNFNQSAQ